MMPPETSPKQLRSFGLLVGGVFALIAVWPVVVRQEAPRWWGLILAAALIAPAVVRPQSLKQIYRLWMAIGNVLGWINTRIILSIVFYGLFTPLGYIMRLLGYEPMRRSFDPGADTYRIERQPRPRSHMTHQF